MVVAAASMVVGAASTAGSAAAASMAGAALAAGLAGAAFMEGTAAFGEATAVTAGAGVGTVGVDMAEAGVTADSVIPTSAWAWVSTPGRIGPDRISAITDILIIRSTGATILMGLIPATPMVMVTVPIPTIPLPTVHIWVNLLIRQGRLR